MPLIKKLLTETTILQGAQLLGVKMNCANLEGANLKGSNFEDPAGSRANLEGVNLKGANLEGSIMAGIFPSLAQRMKDHEILLLFRDKPSGCNIEECQHAKL